MVLCACGHDFGPDPGYVTCPKCGASMQPGLGQVFAARLVSESHHPDGSEEIVVGGFDHRSTTRTRPDGTVQHLYVGRPARSEQDVLQACESLMEALKANAIKLIGKFATPGGVEDGTDAEATIEDGRKIKVQVVGVRREAVLSDLGRNKDVASEATPEELADDVVSAVKFKRDTYPLEVRQGRVLLIDALRSPAHTTPAVFGALSKRENDLRDAGFSEVWIAGPLPTQTRRLD